MSIAVVAASRPIARAESVVAILQTRLDEHKAAIALNNQAVSLLSRGCYVDALATLKDAIEFMRSTTTVLDPTRADCPVPLPVSKDNMQQSLRKACQRMATHCNAKCSRGPEMPRLQVLSSQVNPAQVYEILTSCSSSNDLSVFFPMTIDPIESESLTNNDVAFEAGVILYNYGLTYECMAATIANDATNAPSTQIRSRVHRLFQMAVAVLAKVGQDVWYGSLTGTASRLLLLQTVLTHTRIDVAIKLNLGDEYDVCCRDMQFLLQMVEFQQRLVPLNDRAIAAAA